MKSQRSPNHRQTRKNEQHYMQHIREPVIYAGWVLVRRFVEFVIPRIYKGSSKGVEHHCTHTKTSKNNPSHQPWSFITKPQPALMNSQQISGTL